MSAVPAPKSVQMQQQHVPSYLQQQQHYQQQQVPSYGSSVVPPPPPPQVPSYGQQQQQPIVVDPQMMYNNNNNQGVYHQQHQGQGQQGYYNNNNYNNHHQGRQNQQQQYSNNKNNTNHNNNNNNIPKENTTGNATNCDPTTHTEVYAFNNVALYTIPHEDILSMPALDDPSNSQIKNLQLCPNFDPKNPATSCDKGAACKFVHAKLDNAETHNIHVNYAWTNPEDVLYETFPAGEMLAVAPPNSNTATDEIPSHLVLKTRALQSNRRVISHCAHYYFNRVCNRGSECYFIHAVSLTPVINEAGYIEDRSRRIWGRTQTKKNPPTNQNSQRQTPTPTPQVSKLGSNLGAVASASGFQTPSYNTLSRQDSTVGRNAGFPTYPPQQNQNGGMALPSLSQMHAAFLNGGSTQDLTKLNTQSDNSDSDGVDGDLDKSANNNNKNQNNNNNSGNGSKQGSKNNSALSSPFRRTHNPYSMTNPVVRSYNGSPVSPVPVHVGSQA